MTTRSRSPNLGPWPTEPVMLDSGSTIHWDRAYHDRSSVYRVPVTCGRCVETRTIEATKTRSKYNGYRFTGLCRFCIAHTLMSGINGDNHPAWHGGRFVVGGYQGIQVCTLSGREKDIASQMSKKFGNGTQIVYEHRLVMAVHLDRPLTKHEVVHHKNGNKLDNRLENLELTSHADHRRLDVKYYALWQEAKKRIEELENELLRYKDSL